MDDERRRILEMVEQGKITSAEADDLMEALKPPPATRGASPGPVRSREKEPDVLGLPVSFIATAARWLAVAVASVAFAARWLRGWWRGQRPRRRYP